MNTDSLKRICYGLAILGLFLGVAGSAAAQWDVSVTYEQEYNTNPFRAVQNTSTWISVFDLAIQRNFSGSSLGYFGYFGSFNQLTDRDFYWHQLAWWGSAGQTYWGTLFEQRLNSQMYNAYNYNVGTAYLTHTIRANNILWRLNGSGKVTFYPELKEFNNIKFDLGVLANKSFPTRTTVIASGGVHYKQYLTKVVSYLDSSNTMRRTSIRMDFYDPVEYEAMPGIMQFDWRVRLAQSLTKSTGLAVQYSQRSLLAQAAKSIADIPYTSYQESEIFDDPMSYNGHSAGSEITQLLPFGLMAKGAFYANWKNYVGQPAYIEPDIYDMGTNRKDVLKNAWIYLEKTVYFTWISEQSITLSVTYQWKENRSNSYWYNYTVHFGSMGIEYNF
ncbi:MAG TPA: hypothetical protein VKA68_14910 [bacterium]|nr:hypothetical protein [bacterium]